MEINSFSRGHKTRAGRSGQRGRGRGGRNGFSLSESRGRDHQDGQLQPQPQQSRGGRGRNRGDPKRGHTGGEGRGGGGRGRGDRGGTRTAHSRGGRGGGRGQGDRGATRGGRSGQPLVHRLNFGEILDLANEDSDDIVSKLEQDLKGFQHSLAGCDQVKESAKSKYIEAVIEIMFKISLLENESSNIIMAEFLSYRCAQFHVMLSEYVQTVDIQHSFTTIQMIFHLCAVILQSFRTYANVPPIKDLRDASRFYPELAARAESLAMMQKEIQNSQRKQTKTANHDEAHFDNWDNSQYRHMPILPTVKEVVGSPPPLRSNIINGCYTGWEHYYDVQFRLLREDFIAPLRKGISEYCSPNRTARLNDVYIYNDVRIIKPVCTQEGLCYNVQFDVSRMRQRRSWEHSKRLMFGSLLCFTTDHFARVIYFATVTNRDPKELEKGVFQVRFEQSLEMLQHAQRTVFVVAESKAFFEASRHILRSLQTAEVETMPFSRYLVLNTPMPVNPPKYFDSVSAEYNLKWLYKNTHRRLRWHSNTSIDVLDDSQWPCETNPDIELDQSQLDAIKMALTQEIAIIQGPPGTGKTYIGYKIVQTLLENRQVWDPHRTSPILVICFTNHALDQFLEGIIHHDISDKNSRRVLSETRKPKIVRIGGRSQSEEVQKYSLRNVRREFVPGNMYHAVQDIKKECNDLASQVAWSSEQLQKVVHNPVDDDIVGGNGMLQLKPFILPSHFYQLTQLVDDTKQVLSTLEMWLGMWKKIEIKEKREEKIEEIEENYPEKDEVNTGLESNTDLVDRETSNEAPTAEEDEDEETLEVKGEAEIEEETRQLEGEDFTPIQAKRLATLDENDTLSHYLKERSEVSELEQEPEEKKITSVWRRKPRYIKKRIIDMINCIDPMEEEVEGLIPDITDPSISDKERYQLLRLWIKKYEESLAVSSQTGIVKYNEKCKEYKTADQNLDRIALERAEVIGMTTTGAAKYQHIIHLVKPKIVIVEEAAELLESHIVSALNAGTQHLILIGDHKQLRPKPNEFDLAMKHNLHISLFERLILNRLPHATLMIQHRMRPQIASLVCPHIYEELVNHDSVKRYGDVKGFRKNMYFFHHEMEEEHDEHLSSHSNEHEAGFIVKLCKHLLMLDYEPSQITVLTAYTGQLLKIKSKMPRKHFEGLQITNVDNFQGEENDIIILSLVRNNDRGSVGFLKEENRVCVALSRARVGLFCFGNFNKLLRVKVPIWDRIMTQVEGEGCLGTAFPLQCPNHPDMVFDVTKPQQFAEFAPEGGCIRDCNHRLDCGHSCKRLCHIDDSDHEKYKCKEVCRKLCVAGEHQCPAPCYKSPCPPCTKSVTREIPQCGHEQEMVCHQDPWLVPCETPCLKLCPNGLHRCPLKCSEGCELCLFPEIKVMPGCEHLQEMFCYQQPKQVLCMQECKKACPSGHPCRKACWEDCGNCMEMVEKKLANCEHRAKMYCYAEPSQHKCRKKCLKVYSCGHHCQKKCYEECDANCTLLVPKMSPKCYHTDDIPCYMDVKLWSCKKPCEKKLLCGHACKLACGQTCLTSECTELREIKLSCEHIVRVECKDFNKMKTKILRGEKIECRSRCKRKLRCGHSCKNACSEPCNIIEYCHEKVTRNCSKGTHELRIACGDPLPRCDKKCLDKLACGHPCKKMCYEECDEGCDFMIKVKCACGHEHKVKCGDESCNCKERCTTILECGHRCSGKCGKCFTTRIHAPCPFDVHVKRFCGHYASVPCFGLEDTCNKSCQLAACLHTPTPCEHKCFEPCDTVCAEPCQYKCAHRECSKPCSQRCDVFPCSKPCDKMLDCGHQCLGICGEKCLSKCIVCNRKKFLSSVKGLEKKSKPESLQYIELNCSHFFTVAFLDKYYQPQAGKDRLVSPLLCPTCQKITVCGRYMKIMKERKEEMRTIKSKVSITTDYNDLDFQRKETELQIFSPYIRSIGRRCPSTDFVKNFKRTTEGMCALELLITIGKLYKKLITESSETCETALGLFERVILLFRRKKTGHQLSFQLLDDIEKELFRISLLYMIDRVLEVGVGVKSLSTVQEIVDAAKTDNSVLDHDVYLECADYLKNKFSLYSHGEVLTEPVNFDDIPSPVVTKGQWYCCAKAGHHYFVPAKYRKGQVVEPCEQCHQ